MCMGGCWRSECLDMGGVRQACKSFLFKQHFHKKSSLEHVPAENKLPPPNQVIDLDRDGGGNGDDMQKGVYPTPRLLRASSAGGNYTSHLSRNSSQRRSKTPSRSGPLRILRSLSRRSMDSLSFPADPAEGPPSLTRRNSTTIMYSNSNGLLKPPSMVKGLECTLEDLCFGCIKKVKVTRDVLTNEGQMIQEDEVLTIKVKPGWRKGTKITFEGMGNETPGTQPADITFVVVEKQHPVFKRRGDDLELAVELPLVKALTGCTISVPFLGGQQSCLTIDEVVSPGYRKIIPGQGMTLPKEQGKRGNLIVKFSVRFPRKLTEEQRSEVYNILRDSC